jgi:hypothetical protein
LSVDVKEKKPHRRRDRADADNDKGGFEQADGSDHRFEIQQTITILPITYPIVPDERHNRALRMTSFICRWKQFSRLQQRQSHQWRCRILKAW